MRRASSATCWASTTRTATSAVYDTLVRLAQWFSLRYPLVDGQGNFGNQDGYRAAAMRYTECRLSPLAVEMLRDIDADTVDFVPNYDGRHREPTVLPSRFPNLLVNGSAGIAVGMATNIPPHNLGEMIDAAVELIDNPDATLEDLMQHIKGPDFPTAASVMGIGGIRDAYATGRGRVVMRAKVHTEEQKGGRNALIVTELPYMVKKGGDDGVITKVAELVQAKVLTEISDINDDSDHTGMRIRIELQARRDPDGGAQQALQAHALQTHVRGQHGGAGRRRPAHALAAADARALHRPPEGGGHPAHQVRARAGRAAGARPRGLPDRARQPRRGHRAHPRRGRRRHGPRRASWSSSG